MKESDNPFIYVRENDWQSERESGNEQDGSHERLDVARLGQRFENVRADHDGHHESGEDEAVRNVSFGGHRQRRCPLEHEHVHGALEQRLNEAEKEHFTVGANCVERRDERLLQVSVSIAIVLRPARRDEEDHDGENEQ